MNELALFAGRGGGLLASKLLGFDTLCAVEIRTDARYCLQQRQRDGVLDKFPIWDDVSTFDGAPWRGKVDIITGGFPCQDISSAGKGAGITGKRSGLWKEYSRIIGEVRPELVFAENSPLLRTRGLGVILQDLSEMGYDARWCVLGAWHLGKIHKRDRMWILAYPERSEWREKQESHSRSTGRVGRVIKPIPQDRDWQSALSTFRRVDDGMARDVGRTDGIRNGQVPIVAATAFRILSAGLIFKGDCDD